MFKSSVLEVFRGDAAEFDEYSDRLFDVDRLLLKSLQLSSSHRSLSKYAAL